MCEETEGERRKTDFALLQTVVNEKSIVKKYIIQSFKNIRQMATSSLAVTCTAMWRCGGVTDIYTLDCCLRDQSR